MKVKIDDYEEVIRALTEIAMAANSGAVESGQRTAWAEPKDIGSLFCHIQDALTELAGNEFTERFFETFEIDMDLANRRDKTHIGQFTTEESVCENGGVHGQRAGEQFSLALADYCGLPRELVDTESFGQLELEAIELAFEETPTNNKGRYLGTLEDAGGVGEYAARTASNILEAIQRRHGLASHDFVGALNLHEYCNWEV